MRFTNTDRHSGEQIAQWSADTFGPRGSHLGGSPVQRLIWNQRLARKSHGVVTPHMSHRTTWRMSLVTVISVPDIGEDAQGDEESAEHDAQDGGEAHGFSASAQFSQCCASAQFSQWCAAGWFSSAIRPPFKAPR